MAPKTGMQIRKAEERDLKRVMEIERSSFTSPWPEGLLRGYLGEDGFLVGEDGEEVVGYILVGLRIPSFFSRLERRTRLLFQRRDETDPELHIGHVMNLAVAVDRRRRGLGSQLLRAGLGYLRDLGAWRVELEVRTQNREAIQLYRKFGFSIERLISRYYSDGDDAYLMALRLRGNP
ncbi:MAG: GNAT family N-acetyltransferase [Candidatus Acetothermia bacterium]|jgi:ribosomal-protein-alanine N-acetyltransferase|nr:GNAT family N-acetyltransferase [Candidatus Acetothermia bacterium]MDH7505564.1 GNAT family N-acetyltransferase [Candidatus Acetothermia bacterium]